MLDGLNAKGGCNMRLSCSGASDQHHIFGHVHELTTMKLTDQGFTDLAGGKVEAREVFIAAFM